MTAPPDGPRGDGSEDGLPLSREYDGELPAGLVIPDDARALELDRRALFRERAIARRRARLTRVFLTRRWHSHGISGPIVAICLLVVFVFAVLLALMVPSGGNGGHPAQPLAASSQAVGTVGSLLPPETLAAAGRNATDLESRALRPGVVLILPDACTTDAAARARCSEAIANAAGSARDFHYASWLVGRSGNAALASLAEAPSESTFAIPLFDSTGQLMAAFPAAVTPTAIFIDPHGLVTQVVHGLLGTTALTPVFDRLAGLA